MELQPFLHTGFEEPMFNPELFPGKDPEVCDFEHKEAAHKGCIPTMGVSLADPPFIEHSEDSMIMENHVLLKGVGSLLVREHHRPRGLVFDNLTFLSFRQNSGSKNKNSVAKLLNVTKNINLLSEINSCIPPDQNAYLVF
jgi:hypothetical protein